MGWNGAGTYGVRVDSARVSDNTTGNAATVTNGVYTVGNQTIGGVKTFTSAVRANEGRRIVNPAGAFVSGAVSVTGTIRIQLPTAAYNNNTMMAMKVVLYNYNTGTSRILHIGGYNFSNGTWFNCFATQEGESGLAGDLNVRFGRSGSRQFIYIGETNSSWSYPQVSVTEFVGGFGGGASLAWASGWAIDFVGSFENVSATRLARTPAAASTSISAGSGLSGGGNLTADRTLAVDSTVVRTSGDQTIGGVKNFTGAINGNGKNIFVTTDSFLRLNQNSSFSSGTWFGGTLIRGDGFYAGSSGGTTDSRVHIASGSYNGTRVIFLNGADGTITTSGNITAFSDISLKENIETIPNAIEKVNQINGITYTRNDVDDKEERHTGVIAQEVEAVLPEAVTTNDDGIKSVAYGNMVGLLIEAIKEQQKEIETLKAIVGEQQHVN
jgi:hypothetical protein